MGRNRKGEGRKYLGIWGFCVLRDGKGEYIGFWTIVNHICWVHKYDGFYQQICSLSELNFLLSLQSKTDNSPIQFHSGICNIDHKLHLVNISHDEIQYKMNGMIMDSLSLLENWHLRLVSKVINIQRYQFGNKKYENR